MLSFLPAPVLGVLSSVALILNLLLWITPFFVVALFKLIIPVPGFRRLCLRGLSTLATNWIDGNTWVSRWHDLEWQVDGVDQLRSDAWYLVVANHQSWTDIFVLQTVFNRRIPFLKFFIKQQLIWVPLLGFAWWALEMPFMRRHSREALEKNPHLRQQDLEATRKLCEGIRHAPTTIMNFAEGTRFSAEKRIQTESPYRYLLRPKSGGLGLVLATLGDTLTAMLDVTIVYSHQPVTFWHLLSGRIRRITVTVREREIPDSLRQGDPEDPEFRARLRDWIDTIWADKDMTIGAAGKTSAAGSQPSVGGQ